MRRNRFSILVAAIAAFAAATAQAGAPLTRAITYQGELTQFGVPAQGEHDIEIALYNGENAPSPVDVQVFDDVTVRDGLFTVRPDFTDAPFEDGYGYWLEVRVRPGTSTGAFTTLAPRHALTPVPYAVSALHVADDGVEADDIIAGAIGAREVDPAQIQTRVTGACAVGQTIRAIAADGSVTCGTSGVEGVVAGTGLTGGGTSGAPEIAIDPAVTQRRVSAQCPSAHMISAINEDGTVICQHRGVTGIQVGLGIAGGGNVPVPTIAIDPATTQRRIGGTCQPGQYVRAIAEDGTVTCGTDSATNVRDVEFVESTCTLGTGPVGTHVCHGAAFCPIGKRAIGGGFDVACAGVYVSRSGPALTPNLTQWYWRTYVIRPSDVTCAAPNNVVTTHVTCATIN